MKYILLNPSFKKEEILIDNPQAVRQIERYLRKPDLIGDYILLSINGVHINLKYKEKFEDKIIFELIRL